MGVFFSVLTDQATHFSCVLQQFIYVKGFFFHKFERILRVPNNDWKTDSNCILQH